MTRRGQPDDVEIYGIKRAYDGFFKLDIVDFRYRRHDRAWSRRLTREVFRRAPTAAVLPYDPRRDEVVLVEQMRPPAIDDPAGPWLVEAVAGVIEPGESAEALVRREAREEAGLDLGAVEHLFDVLLSPGGSTERISLFVGEADTAGAGGLFGVAAEGEDIRAVVWPADAALAAIGTKVVTAPAILCLQWLALNRARLHRGWARAGARPA